MRRPRSFESAYNGSNTVEEVLGKKGMLHTYFRLRDEQDSHFAEGVYDLVAAGFAPAKGTKRPRSIETLVDDLTRIGVQGTFPFDPPGVREAEVDALIAAVETVMPYPIHHEDTGELISVREAMASPELWRRVIGVVTKLAHELREQSDTTNGVLCAIMEIEGRLNILGGGWREAAE
jgi:hypothetical protein